ncbi:hypothetical protein F5051DRAFT_38747 [Lentinula edodes]|nr:hypothetical protein F5051DRAFT_38747 [Lentinula edodes]
MSYLTPAQILDQAAYKYASGEYQPPQCRASINMGVVPAQLHKESPYYSTSRTSQVESLISSHYAGHNSRHDSNASRPAHHHHSATSVQRQRSMPMIEFSGGPSYAPSIPVTSFESHDPYPSMSSVVPAPLSERRNSEDTSPFHECTHMKHKGSGGGTSYAYPDYLNLPPDYRSASKDTHRQFEYPGYLNLPPGYSRDSNNIQKQTKYPDYLNLPEEYRTSQAQVNFYLVTSFAHPIDTSCSMDLFGRLATPDILRILIPSLHRATILPSRLSPPSDVEVILNSIVILQIRFPSSKTAGAPLITFVCRKESFTTKQI